MRSEKYNQYKNKILAFYQRSKRMPSHTEVAELMNFKSRGSALYLINKFVEEGFIKRDSKGRLIANFNLKVPVIGTIHAGKTVGFPNPSEEETHDTMDLAELLEVDMVSSAIFRVQGESLIDAGIFPDDILHVERTDKYKVGDLVIAEIDGEETVKYLRKKDGKLYLEAANKTIADMHPQEYLKIKAVVKHVIRSI